MTGTADSSPDSPQGVVASNKKFIWVICLDHYTEGLGEPIAAFEREEDAVEVFTLVKTSMSPYRLLQVPLFRSYVKETAV